MARRKGGGGPAEAGRPVVEMENVRKEYVQGQEKVNALDGVSLTVERGEYVAITGPSGSGKSTLMNVIGCLDRPTSGTYVLDGRNVAEMSDDELAEARLRELGFVFQNFQLLPRHTALENVMLPLVYARVPKRERRERAAEALRSVGLGDRLGFDPSQLSGGQKQRVAVARAMVNRPSLLLADEPTGALDSKSSAQLMELFEKLNEEGTTILMITHSAEVASRAKRKASILDGKLTEEGGWAS